MKTIIMLLLASLTLLVFSCGNQDHRHGKELHADSHKAAHTGHADLELDSGEKWKADGPTLDYVRQMEEEAEAYIASDDMDHKALAASLQEKIKGLTVSCSMEGKAHDELHKWLVPYIGMVKELGHANDQEAAEKIVSDIQSSLGTFHLYFK